MDESLNLSDLLVFNQDKGRISLWDYRMVMFSARAWSCLREELIGSMGLEEARGAMKRFGFEAGAADGKALQESIPFLADNPLEMVRTLAGFNGFSALVLDEKTSRIDATAFHIEGNLLDSCEAEPGEKETDTGPACWFLSGYLMGCLTALTKSPLLVVETECRAEGHERCRFVAGHEDQLPSWYARELSEYQPSNLHEKLQILQETATYQESQLEEQESTILALNETIAEQGSQQNKQPEEAVEPPLETEEFLGSGSALKRLMETAAMVAPTPNPLMLIGEPGTGKSMLARWIHVHSPRAEGPFRAMRCRLFPRLLQEAEILGTVAGALPGVQQDVPGLLESCHGGTLYLADVETLGVEVQAALVRYLREGVVSRKGEDRTHSPDVRLIVSTAADLQALVAEERFLESLYYCLEGISLQVPSLGERDNDILLLADRFLAQYAAETGKTVNGISSRVKKILANYSWPENIRELKRVLEHAVLVTDNEMIEVCDLNAKILTGATPPAEKLLPPDKLPPADKLTEIPPKRQIAAGLESEAERLERYRLEVMGIKSERKRVELALHLVEGSRVRAARILGMGRTTLWRRMNRWGMN